MIPDVWKNWRNTNQRGRYSLVLDVVYRDQMNSCDLAWNQGNLVAEGDCVVLSCWPSRCSVQGSARRFVTDFVEDETEGNAIEAPEDFASAELVAASVLCAQPKKNYLFPSILLNICMHILCAK